MQCRLSSDCDASAPVCFAGTCHAKVDCTSDKHCADTNGLCDKVAGHCVECLSKDDCAATSGGKSAPRCKLGSCVEPVITCNSTKECSSAGMVCNKAMHECVGCVDAADCADEAFCKEGVCLPDACKPGEKACDTADSQAAAVKTCGADGGTWTVSPCGNDTDGKPQTCVTGACKDVICTAGSKMCLGTAVATCDATGTALGNKTDCPTGETCKDGGCVTGICTPGDTACLTADKDGVSSALMTCAADGLSWKPTACVAGFESCAAGPPPGCKKHVCAPKSGYCDADVVKLCAADGLTGTTQLDCAKATGADGKPAPAKCVSGACLSAKCTAAAVLCVGNTLVTCNVTGDGYKSAPCASGDTCKGGVCGKIACTAATAFCDGSRLLQCNAKGDAATQTTDCAAEGKACQGGKCIPLLCAPSTSSCRGDAKTVLTCKADGLGYVEQACGASSSCIKGKCVAQVCTPDKPFCAGNALKNCDKTGTIATLARECGSEICVAGQCQKLVCKPDATECVGTTKLRTCIDKGLKWSETGCASGTACTKGACQKVICKPAELGCDGNTAIRTCDATGTGWIAGQDCTKSKLWCVQGKCQSQVCQPNAAVCFGKTLKTCADDGLSFAKESPCDDNNACTDNLCVTGKCAFSAPKSCDDKQPCTIDTCSAATGACSNTASSDLCDDGNACTLAETCAGGKCAPDATGTRLVETLTDAVKNPTGVAVHPSGDVYVCSIDHRIYRYQQGKISVFAGTSSGFTDGPSGQARFYYPHGLAFGPQGKRSYVADRTNHRVRVIEAGVVSTLAGNGKATLKNGPGAQASFYKPYDVALDSSGAVLVADVSTHSIRAIAAGGNVTTVAGGIGAGYVDGPLTTARFNTPFAVAVDGKGGVYVSDRSNRRVRLIQAGKVTTIAGGGSSTNPSGPALGMLIDYPTGIQVLASGSVVVVDHTRHRVLQLTNGQATTIAGAFNAQCSNPQHENACDDGDGCTVGDTCEAGKCLAGKGTLSTLAGTGASAFIDGDAAKSVFMTLQGVAIAADGAVFVSECGNHRIRRIAAGQVKTYGGTGEAAHADGPVSGAKFNCPGGMEFTRDGALIIADIANHRVRQIGPAGYVSTLAGTGTAGYQDGPAASAQFSSPADVAVAPDGTLFVSDRSNNRIRRVAPTGVVSTLAGSGTAGYLDGAATSAQFRTPVGIVLAPNGTLFVSDQANHRIRTISNSAVGTFAGSTAGYQDGPGSSAKFYSPTSIALDPWGALLVADLNNNRVRKVLADKSVTTVAGSGSASTSDGQAQKSAMNRPFGLAVQADGAIVVVTNIGNRVRRIVVGKKYCDDGLSCTTDACDSKAAKCVFTKLAVGKACDDGSKCTTTDACDAAGKCVGKAKSCDDGNACTFDWCESHSAKCVNEPTEAACDDGSKCTTGDRCTEGKCVSLRGWITTLAGTTAGHVDGKASDAKFNSPWGIAIGSKDEVYIADATNHRIRKLAGGIVTTVAGAGTAGYLDGPVSSAQFNYPRAVVAMTDGRIVVADNNNYRLRVVDNGKVSTLTGSGTSGYQDGVASSAKLGVVYGLAAAKDGTLVFADRSFHRVRGVAKDGALSTIAGSGTAGFQDGPASSAKFYGPQGAALDAAGGVLVADFSNQRIRRISGNVVTTVAGSTAGFVDGKGAAARFSGPTDLGINALGEIYVIDSNNHRIRVIGVDGVVTTIAGSSLAGSVDGFGGSALLNGLRSMALDAAGNLLFTESATHRIRKLTEPNVLCADGDACTTDKCDIKTATCSYPAIANGGGCTGYDKPCLSKMTCQSGKCQGGVDTACDDDNACSLDKCDAKTGACSYSAASGVSGCKAVRRVFVTSQRFTGNLGRTDGADALCAQAASNAKLGGTWKAWLAGHNQLGQSALPAGWADKGSAPYVRTDGAVVASGWNDLIDGSLGNPINVDEHGKTVTGDADAEYCKQITRVWTNAEKNGNLTTPSTNYSCSDWTYNATGRRGYVGNAAAKDATWTRTACAEGCHMTARLYCFEQADYYTK